jgi:hypothetical protein
MKMWIITRTYSESTPDDKIKLWNVLAYIINLVLSCLVIIIIMQLYRYVICLIIYCRFFLTYLKKNIIEVYYFMMTWIRYTGVTSIQISILFWLFYTRKTILCIKYISNVTVFIFIYNCIGDPVNINFMWVTYLLFRCYNQSGINCIIILFVKMKRLLINFFKIKFIFGITVNMSEARWLIVILQKL